MKSLVITEGNATHFIPASSILSATFKPSRTERLDKTPYFPRKSDYRRTNTDEVSCPPQIEIVLPQQHGHEGHGSYNAEMIFYGEDAERMFNFIVEGSDDCVGRFDFGENEFEPMNPPNQETE